MKNILNLTLLSGLMSLGAFADTIQNVEYHLPKATENWVVSNKLESQKGTTIVYTPPGVERQKAEEFFAVNANILPSDGNPENIKLGLTMNFPNMSIDLQVLEQVPASVTYEWSGQENGSEKIHGWGRAFSNQEGTVSLMYLTRKISEVPQARAIWLPALKEAKQ